MWNTVGSYSVPLELVISTDSSQEVVRLPGTFLPSHYHLHLSPDLEAGTLPRFLYKERFL